MRLLNALIIIMGLLASTGVMQSCTTSGSGQESHGNTVEIKYSKNLSIEEFDGYTKVIIRNPWDTSKTLQKLVLLEEGVGIDRTLFNGGEEVITVPLKKSVVFSAIHNSLIKELGEPGAVVGICDVDYIKEPEVQEMIRSGNLADCGNSMAPNIEKIISLDPDATLLSPYETGGMEDKLRKVGIPIVECADYMESTPLGRAEWVKFFGRLYGKEREADSLFKETERKYLTLSGEARKSGTRPKILFDRLYGGVWSVPGGRSTIGRLINDAAGTNPFGKEEKAGSLNLSGEQVLYEAGDSDFWFIRYAGSDLTKDALIKDKQLYGEFKAYKDGKIYFSDTTTSGIFEDFAFHPDLLLGQLIEIIHPELNIKCEKEYFNLLPER